MSRKPATLLALALAAGLAVAALAATGASQEPAPETPAVAAPAAPAVLPPFEPEPAPMSTGITCTFNCADGTGFFYDCPDPTLNECCQQAAPACSSHGGLTSGICKKGHLGLSCVPL